MKSLHRLLPIPFFLLLVLTSVSPLYAEDGAVLLTGDVQLKIADAFMEEGEYYRAVTEYKKFLILFPDSAKADYASFKIAMAYFKGEEYGAAARSFLAMREKYPESSHAIEAGYLEGVSQWKLKNYDRARMALESLVEQHPESDYAPRSLVVICLAALDENKAEVSRQALQRFLDRYPGHPGEENIKEAAVQLEKYQELPEKSPALAGFLSAILPGSGYIYAEHYGDGVTALLINGLFIAGTVAAIHQENYAVAGIVGGIGVPFYLGNIYGSANAAKKWNLGIRNEVIQKIHSILSPLL
ncbi:MAG TPA: tetratricopeptide repeat protein [Syntrophales bacterium]|nr:tetratricopeptide repeat protein [Syntrophales bacterium]